MRHKLDIHPIPENTIYVNELDLSENNCMYETKEQAELALTGKTTAQGGILPDDNVRVYIPLDINERYILSRLRDIYDRLGFVSEENEFAYSSAVRRIISELEIYDQILTVRDLKNAVNLAKPGEIQNYRSREGMAAAKKMIEYMEEHEGTAECFPYDVIEELRVTFGLNHTFE